MQNDEPREPTISELMPFVEPDGVAHVKLAIRNMELALVRQRLAQLEAQAQPVLNGEAPTDEQIHALLGDARTEPSA